MFLPKGALTKPATRVTGEKDVEIRRLRDADPVVQSLREQIVTLTNEIAALGAQIQSLEQQVVQATQQVERKNLEILQLDTQISEVNRRLGSDPSNAELLRLRERLLAERSATTTARGEAQRNKTSIETNAVAARGSLAGKTTLKQAKEREFEGRMSTLGHTTAALVRTSSSTADEMTKTRHS